MSFAKFIVTWHVHNWSDTLGNIMITKQDFEKYLMESSKLSANVHVPDANGKYQLLEWSRCKRSLDVKRISTLCCLLTE